MASFFLLLLVLFAGVFGVWTCDSESRFRVAVIGMLTILTVIATGIFVVLVGSP